MPIIKSAKKRVKVSRKAAARNSRTKRNLKDSLKAFSSKSTDKTHKSAQSAIDIALNKHIIHKNKAARLKSRASKKAKQAGLKITKSAPKKAEPAQAKPKSAVKSVK